jgi:hypothetical protein
VGLHVRVGSEAHDVLTDRQFPLVKGADNWLPGDKETHAAARKRCRGIGREVFRLTRVAQQLQSVDCHSDEVQCPSARLFCLHSTLAQYGRALNVDCIQCTGWFPECLWLIVTDESLPEGAIGNSAAGYMIVPI